jgi:hypothetical protein
MKKDTVVDEEPVMIFVLSLIYGLHMVEEFTCGFVEWGDRYFGKFDWTQNLIGNFIFFVVLAFGCYLYYKNPAKYLWAGMAGCMWVLSNAFIHLSATLLGNEYSPGVVTATILYIPGGLYFIIQWGKRGVLNGKNLTLSFAVGAMIFMLNPTFVRAIVLHAKLATIFHLVS